MHYLIMLYVVSYMVYMQVDSYVKVLHSFATDIKHIEDTIDDESVVFHVVTACVNYCVECIIIPRTRWFPKKSWN